MLNCAQCLNSTVCQACHVGTVVTGGCTSDLFCLEVAQINPNTTSHSAHCLQCSSPDLIPSGASCVVGGCTDSMPYCKSCVSSTQCTECYVGYLVNRLCTLTAGCGSPNPVTGGCLACASSDMVLVDGKCECVQTGWVVVDGQCLSMEGCISATVSPLGGGICLACNNSMSMSLSNGVCVCSDGFYMTGGTCIETCGDGRLFTLECDDNNTNDGDGCSSQCTE